MSNVPYIITNGAAAYKQLGTEKSPGPKIYCLSGHVKRPGNYEAELGKITFRDLIFGEEFGQGLMTEGRKVKAILPSGASGPIVTDSVLDVPLDYESVAAAGTILGSASMIIMDDSIDMVWAAGQSDALLPPRIVRQVYAMPRRHVLDGEAIQSHSGRQGDVIGCADIAGRGESDDRQVPVSAG